MSHKIVLLTEKPRESDNMDRVVVTVDHDKSRKRVDMSVYPAQGRDDGLLIIAVTQGKYFPVEPMPRLNRAKLSLIQEGVQHQCDRQEGPLWEKIKESAESFGLTIVPKPSEENTP